MQLKRFTKSRFGTWRLCHQHYYLAYVEGHECEPGEPGLIGRETHQYRELVCSGKMSLEAALKEMRYSRAGEYLNLAIANDSRWAQTFDYEKRVALNFKGELCEEDGKEFIVSILDRVGQIDKKTVVVEDLKTNHPDWETDDEVERHTYVLAARALFPKTKRFLFEYFYCRSGRRVTWEYLFKSKQTVIITSPKGESETVNTRGLNPLLKYVRDRAQDIIKSKPTPNPGRHCQNWFGAPCPFLGSLCALSQDVPAIIKEPETLPDITTQELLAMPIDRAVGAAFMILDRGLPPEQITPEIASLALQGLQQVQARAGAVEKKIKGWCEDTGKTIPVGEAEYGWFDKVKDGVAPEDATAAVEIMLANDFTAEEIAKACGPTKTSLNKISKRAHGDVKQQILDLCVTPIKSSRKFGLIEKEGGGEVDA